MTYLNAPWRNKYYNESKEKCPFCEKSPALLYEAKYSKVIMNKYPYSPGHILIIPNIHVEFLKDLDDETWLEMAKIAKFAESLMFELLNAHGVNMGFNLGDAAGAGLAKHLHFHILPRWQKDTNFITTLANTRVLGTSEDEMYLKLKEGFKKYNV